MFGPVSLQRLALVHPTLSELMRQLEMTMSEAIGITMGVRTDQEQGALYCQGRQPLDYVNTLRAAVGWAPITAEANGRTVTNAKPGYSWHPFGLAVDAVPFDSAMHPDWDESHPAWQEMVTKGEALGLVSGISWKDEPHFQMTGRFPITPTDEVRSLMVAGGMPAVWQAAGIQAR
jgi:peptidoglycan L-alanyl-D-glutamate endopeptidase CwlK